MLQSLLYMHGVEESMYGGCISCMSLPTNAQQYWDPTSYARMRSLPFAGTRLYYLPCPSALNFFWFSSGFRITAPAQSSATVLPSAIANGNRNRSRQSHGWQWNALWFTVSMFLHGLCLWGGGLRATCAYVSCILIIKFLSNDEGASSSLSHNCHVATSDILTLHALGKLQQIWLWAIYLYHVCFKILIVTSKQS